VVQFKEWNVIWSQPEALSITIFNVTNAAKMSQTLNPEGTPTHKALDPVRMQRTFVDCGDFSYAGDLGINLCTNTVVTSDIEALSNTIAVPNVGFIAGKNNNVLTTNNNLFTVGKMSTVLASYYATGAGSQNYMLTTPAKNTALRNTYAGRQARPGVRMLLFFNSIGSNADKCLANPYCGAACAWSTSCEPLNYGHHGLLMPSGSFFLSFAKFNGIAHWPWVPWNWEEYLKDAELPPKFNFVLFSPETMVHSEYTVTEETTLEKFPGVKFHLWKTLQLRGSCGGPSVVVGKDCNSPTGHVSVDYRFNKKLNINLLYIHQAESSGTEIYAELISGLRMDFLDSWQMSAHVRSPADSSSGVKVEKYPLFWMSRRPASNNRVEMGIDMFKITNKFDEYFQGYGDAMIFFELIGFAVYALTFWMFLYMFFYGLSCVGFINDVSARFKPLAPQYI